jgi:hypothetical protein
VGAGSGSSFVRAGQVSKEVAEARGEPRSESGEAPRDLRFESEGWVRWAGWLGLRLKPSEGVWLKAEALAVPLAAV